MLDLAAARALHDETCVLDLHADTPKLMDKLGWDLARRHARPMPWFGHVDLPRMREGGLGAQFFGMWTFPKPQRGSAASVHRQIDALEAACARAPDEIVRCRSREDVAAARAAGRVAALAGIEGAHALEGDLANVEAFARRGVRYIGLLHFSRNDLGCPAMGLGRDDARGLTPFGHAVVEEMNRLGVIVDLAHINRKGFFDAVAATKAAPIVSHTGVAGVRAHWRNIDDEQIRAVAQRGGVVGVIFAPRFLGGDDLDAVCDHLAHIIKVGGEDVPALGSDYDGMVKPPRGLDDVADLPRLTAALLARGVPRAAVKKLLGENALRVLAEVPPVLS
ncbi:MAG TPA: dipeptidase [Haliangiales bacterium]|nr:dipeptidase [Haliangiales bacterium]